MSDEILDSVARTLRLFDGRFDIRIEDLAAAADCDARGTVRALIRLYERGQVRMPHIVVEQLRLRSKLKPFRSQR